MLKNFLLAATLTAAAASAQAATMTAVITGTIFSLYDQTDTLGAPEADTLALPITATFIYDTGLGDRVSIPGQSDEVLGGLGYGVAEDPSVTASFTIGAVTRSNDGIRYARFDVCDISLCTFDRWSGLSEGIISLPDGTYSETRLSVDIVSFLSDFAAGDLETPFSAGGLASPQFFDLAGFFSHYATDTDGTVLQFFYGNFTVDSIAVTRAETAAVPLPASGLTLFAAFGALGMIAARRRRPPAA